MGKIVVNEFISLDGVAQAPGLPDEDRTGGFAHGGWHMRFMDDIAGKWVTDLISNAGGFLLGRRTYEIFAAYWPNAPEEEQVVGRPLNTLPKYVASRTLSEPLAWENSRLLQGEVPGAVRALKEENVQPLLVIGSTVLVQTLYEHGLVDEYRLMIDPLLLGGGKRIFRDDGRLQSLKLVDSQITTSGAVMATYTPA